MTYFPLSIVWSKALRLKFLCLFLASLACLIYVFLFFTETLILRPVLIQPHLLHEEVTSYPSPLSQTAKPGFHDHTTFKVMTNLLPTFYIAQRTDLLGPQTSSW